jgi:uncharacterized protein
MTALPVAAAAAGRVWPAEAPGTGFCAVSRTCLIGRARSIHRPGCVSVRLGSFCFPARWAASYDKRMALVRVLIDGYSLLHNWPELARGRARHSAAARDELIRRLTLYQDATGTPLTIFFDGGGAPAGTPRVHSTPEVEVLYSRGGQTADDMIERAAYRFGAYGEVLAVTDDLAERETVLSMGGFASSCWNFIQTVKDTLAEAADDLKHHNRRERHRFQRSR